MTRIETIEVADAFMDESYYRACFAKHPEFSLEKVVFFGEPDRINMRGPVHRIERGGPDAVEPPEDLYGLVADAEAIMVHLCPVNRQVIQCARNLRLILSNRGGLENIDVAAATQRGIPVLHNPAHNANAVAELTIGLMVAEMRNLARTHGSMKQGVWREKFPNSGRVYEIVGKTVGIIGFGNIGRRVARKLTVFDCRVLVCDPFIPSDDPDLARYHCKLVDLPALLSQSDIVSLHVRTDSPIPVLGRAEFELMKPHSYFINTARPHLIDNAALHERLRAGKILGAAFDVFLTEPIKPDEPYLTLDNVTLSNHRGGDTVNCYSDSPAMLLTEALKLLSGGEPKFFANKSELHPNIGQAPEVTRSRKPPQQANN